MTSPEPFSRQELIELAALHTYGLLDEFDAADYTRSLLNAPAPVQDDVRQLQAEIAGDLGLLPDEEPSPALRQRVLDGVAEAIEADTAQLAPLATIGRARGRAAYDDRASLGFSGQFWRAAAFALAGGLIVVAYFWADAYRWGNQIASAAITNATEEVIQLVGPPVTDFLKDPNCGRIVLKPAGGKGPGWANVMLREDAKSAFVVFGGLPRSEEGGFSLQVKLADGSTETLASFDSTGMTPGGAHVRRINIAATILASATWQITSRSGQLVLTSA